LGVSLRLKLKRASGLVRQASRFKIDDYGSTFGGKMKRKWLLDTMVSFAADTTYFAPSEKIYAKFSCKRFRKLVKKII
jgi:hypothetical protein